MGYTDDLTNLQEQMRNYMERLNAGKLSNKDSSLMIQVAGSYYEALEGYQKQEQEKAEADAKVAFDDILNKISAFQDSIIKGDSQEIREAFEDLSKAADNMIMEAQKQELLMDVFKTDLQEMDLHEAKMRSLQSIVDMDIKLYGSVSKVTLEVLDVQHCELVDDHLVQEKDENDIETAREVILENEEKTQETKEVKTLNTGDILKLKLPKMDAKQKREVENMLYQAGARYHKYTIPAEKSRSHEEISGKNWYVRLTAEMNINSFIPYIREAILHDPKLGAAQAAQKMVDVVEWNKKRFIDGPEGHKALISALAEKLNNKTRICTFIENLHDELEHGNDGVSLSLAAHCVLSDFDGAIDDLDKLLSIRDERKVKQPIQAEGKEQSYQGSAYLKGTGEKQEPIILYGNSPEDIISTLQGWNSGRTGEMQLKTCYIKKLNTETNKYENIAKYEIDSGSDITPIYLNLPHMSRDKFSKVAAELRSNGAKYNPVRKAFFITKQDDLNKFAEYLPMTGTQAEAGENRSQNELTYEVESGQEYYDNRVKVTIEGMDPFNVYGDDYDVHFPSLSAESTREIIEKFVLPELDMSKTQRISKQEIEYNGRKYDPLQYDVLELALKQNFTQEQMTLLERPELTSDRLNEIRFAINDGLSAEQIAQFATPAHEQWQMDLCRIGFQHGMTYNDLKPVINPDGYSIEQWGARRNQLAKMIKEQEKSRNTDLKQDLPSKSVQNEKGDRKSILAKLDQNKAKLEAEHADKDNHVFEKSERRTEIEK